MANTYQEAQAHLERTLETLREQNSPNAHAVLSATTECLLFLEKKFGKSFEELQQELEQRLGPVSLALLESYAEVIAKSEEFLTTHFFSLVDKISERPDIWSKVPMSSLPVRFEALIGSGRFKTEQDVLAEFNARAKYLKGVVTSFINLTNRNGNTTPRFDYDISQEPPVGIDADILELRKLYLMMQEVIIARKNALGLS